MPKRKAFWLSLKVSRTIWTESDSLRSPSRRLSETSTRSGSLSKADDSHVERGLGEEQADFRPLGGRGPVVRFLLDEVGKGFDRRPLFVGHQPVHHRAFHALGERLDRSFIRRGGGSRGQGREEQAAGQERQTKTPEASGIHRETHHRRARILRANEHGRNRDPSQLYRR